MGTKYSSNASSGYNSTPPADDGTVSEANKVKYSTIKTKLADPIKTLADTINSELATHFDNGPNNYTTSQTLAAANYNQVNQVSGSGVTLSLTAATTLTAGWYTDIVSTDTTNSVSLSRLSASDTINETSSDITILPLQQLRVIVNAAATGFLVSESARRTKKHQVGEETQLISKSLWTAEGAAVASAADCNIWGVTDGNTVHITGTTTIADWGTAPQAGAWMRVIFDGALTLTYNATTNDIEGGADVVIAAGDSCIVYANSALAYQVFNISRNTNAEFTIASATTTSLGTSPSDNVLISGTTTITGLGTAAAGVRKNVRFSGVLTLTYNATSLILPGAVSITTAANDTGTAISLGSGNWIFTDYCRASGLPMKATFTTGTAVNATGTTVNITGLPTGITRLHLIFSGVSIDALDDVIIQLGDSGGIETTGYESNSAATTYFNVAPSLAAAEFSSGIITLILTGTNTWIVHGALKHNTTTVTHTVGSKTLTATLDRVRITTPPVTAQFDAGTINVAYDRVS